MFNQTWNWGQEGDEWSAPWGGSEALWWGSLLPRVRAFLPADTILEIAPGHGRVTQFLKDYCHRLVLVDLAQGCIEACRRRFSACGHIEYHVNDGYLLDVVPDGSVDLAFSFDSLVHAEADVIRAYVTQLAKKLKPDGVGFLHHSNLGAYSRAVSLVRAVPSARLQALLGRAGILVNLTHWRSASMTASLFPEFCRSAGLRCISQEWINWGGGPYLIDCFSVFAPRNSIWARPIRVYKNRWFAREAAQIAAWQRLYMRGEVRNGGRQRSHPLP